MKTKLQFIFLLSVCTLWQSVTSAQSIAAGYSHSLALCSDSTVRAWGDGTAGQLGNGNFANSNVPDQVSGLNSVIALACGGYHSLALKNDGTVWAWGDNNNGQLGNGNYTDSNVPVQVSGLTDVIAIAGGGYHSLALKNDSTVWAWGDNTAGQLGNGIWGDSSNVPVQVSGLTGGIAIAGGAMHSLALKNDSTTWSWGMGVVGQLGTGSAGQNTPGQLGISNIVALAAGGIHSLALQNNGTALAWGGNMHGQCGNGGFSIHQFPVSVFGITDLVVLSGGGLHSLALKNDSTAWAWGDNTAGQLGNGNYTGGIVPVQVSGLTGVIAIAGGGNPVVPMPNDTIAHSLALKNDGTVWAWGDNSFGQLGNGNNLNSNVPVQVINLCTVTSSYEENYEENRVLSIYPNPTNSILNLSLNKTENIIITNVFGEIILNTNAKGKVELDVSFLAPGIYFIKVGNEVRKFVKG